MGSIDWGASKSMDASHKAILIARELKRRTEAERLAGDLYAFFKAAWPVLEPSTTLVENWHLRTVCGYLQALEEKRLRSNRLIINIPPGASKSLITSVVYPAWIWARDPARRILSTSNEDGLVTRDCVAMRTLIMSEWYQGLWGDRVKLAGDQSEKRYFQTDKRGFRQGVPIRGSVTGKRGDILLIDDPHDAKKAFSDVEIAATIQAYDQGLSTRLNNLETSPIVCIMQRLRTNDLTGHLLGKKRSSWVQICIPMEYSGEPGFDPVRDIGPDAAHLADPRRERGELLDPVRFSRAVVESLKEDLGEYGAAGQLDQRPSPLSGGIIKRAHWRVWPDDKPYPRILHTFASWDTAYSKRDLEDLAYSACTTWGVWLDESDLGPAHPNGRHKLLLLSAWWGRVDIDELIAEAKRIESKKLTNHHDAHLIEDMASGKSLVQAMRRRSKCRVIRYDPKHDGGGDKVFRAHVAAPSFKAGMVYIPNREWAEEVADVVATFPSGDALSKDLTDTVTQAVNFLNRGWWIHHPDDDMIPDVSPALDTDDIPDTLDAIRSRGNGRGYGLM
jgi:predicted phage terminase large subunit-like protein